LEASSAGFGRISPRRTAQFAFDVS
jgi:hypothetical protein